MDLYVSVTGLRLHSPLQLPAFWLHAIRSFRQAEQAAGNISTQARQIDGVHHTVTVWTSRTAMLTYLREGAHLAAMQAFHRLGTGKVCGYVTTQPPTWEEAIDHWKLNARQV